MANIFILYMSRVYKDETQYLYSIGGSVGLLSLDEDREYRSDVIYM